MGTVIAVLRRFWILMVDEWRALSRSRRGRAAAILYVMVTLAPLLIYFWVRARYVVLWPVNAVDVTRYLAGHWLILLGLIMMLAQDTLSRGDHEGWQESWATLPVGEISWLLGRTFGRAVWIAVVFIVPWAVGWGLSCLWAHRWLDAVPFAVGLLEGPLLALALLLPVVILAGCVGNSLVGSCITFIALIVGVQITGGIAGYCADKYQKSHPKVIMIYPDFPYGEILTAGNGSLLYYLGSFHSIFFPREGAATQIVDYWQLPFGPDPGRGWPPFQDTGDAKRFKAAGLHWLAFMGAAPFLVRLRRRSGRWVPRLKRFPTFGRWLSETVDLARPVPPSSPAARLTCLSAIVVLVTAFPFLVIRAFDLQETNRHLKTGLDAFKDGKGYPDTFEPIRRDLELAITQEGALEGRAMLKGIAHGRPGRPVPFVLSPGIMVERVLDGNGDPCAWQRDPNLLWVVPGPDGGVAYDIEFTGRPFFPFNDNAFDLLDAILPPFQFRRWFVNLQPFSWAPEPLASIGRMERFGGRRACWGPTSLRLRFPGRLIPLPIPGSWEERRDGAFVTARWEGTSPFLPPVVAGRFELFRSGGAPAVTVAMTSPGCDGRGMLEMVQKFLEKRTVNPAVREIIFRDISRNSYWSQESMDLVDPPINVLPGLITLHPASMDLRSFDLAEGWVNYWLDEKLGLMQAHYRYAVFAPRVEEVRPPLARRLIWRLCRTLENWPPEQAALELMGNEATAMREINLAGPPGKGGRYWEYYLDKLNTVCVYLIRLRGPEAIEAALDRLSRREGLLTMEVIWAELSEGAGEGFSWFKDQLLFGRGLAKPAIRKVEAERTAAGWEVRVQLTNEGDVFTNVPLRVLTASVPQVRRVPLDPGQEATVSFILTDQPEQVLLDPDGEVLREKPVIGGRWRRREGLK